VALTPEQLMAINDPVGSGTGSSPSREPVFRKQEANIQPADIVAEFHELDRVKGFGSDAIGAQNSANARANRDSALKQLGIQKRRLEFQQRTGMRDIEQGRAKGLKGAINNALQRGIFRSGIRLENMAEVERESDEAGSDLRENIGLSLEALAVQREGLAAQSFGAGSSSSDSGRISAEELDEKAPDLAAARNAQIEATNVEGKRLFDLNTQTPVSGTGIVPIEKPVQQRGNQR